MCSRAALLHLEDTMNSQDCHSGGKYSMMPKKFGFSYSQGLPNKIMSQNPAKKIQE